MTTPDNPRDRYRAQVRAEVLGVAWKQLSQLPAQELSIKAIADEMRLTPPALYRYIGSRDELMGELVTRVEDELADVVEAAASDDELVTIAIELRRWAVNHRYHYLHRSASAEIDPTRASEQRALAAIERSLERGELRPRPRPNRLDATTTSARERAVTFWTRVHGLLGLELTGHLDGLGIDPEAHLIREITGPVQPLLTAS